VGSGELPGGAVGHLGVRQLIYEGHIYILMKYWCKVKYEF
jgi:hypothetical protein